MLGVGARAVATAIDTEVGPAGVVEQESARHWLSTSRGRGLSWPAHYGKSGMAIQGQLTQQMRSEVHVTVSLVPNAGISKSTTRWRVAPTISGTTVPRNYSITPTRAPEDIRDASHPAPIWRAPRGALRFDGGLVVPRPARLPATAARSMPQSGAPSGDDTRPRDCVGKSTNADRLWRPGGRPVST